MGEPKISIADIAQQAGVSAATVSRVFNHPELVNQHTVQAVLHAMEALNYTPRLTKKKPGKRLALINIPDFSNPFYDQVLKGIITSLENHEINTLINPDNLRDEKALANFLAIAKSVKACGVITCSHLQTEQYAQLSAIAPLVQCCEYTSEEYSYVSIDDFQAAYSAMEHIHSQGCTNIAFVNGPLEYKYALERRRGYEAFLEQAGLPLNPNWIVQLPDIDYDMGFAAIRQLLTSSTPPDAIFAASDLIAAAALRAAKSLQINVPQDLVVVGFDNINIATICDPPITTVSQPRFQLGYTAGEILYDRITTPHSQPQKVFLNTELIIRDSSSHIRSMPPV